MKTLITLVISYYRGRRLFDSECLEQTLLLHTSTVDFVNKMVIALQDRNGTSTIIYGVYIIYMGEGPARRDQCTFSPISVYTLALKVHATRKC